MDTGPGGTDVTLIPSSPRSRRRPPDRTRPELTHVLVYRPPAVPHRRREYRDRPKPPLNDRQQAVLAMLGDEPLRPSEIRDRLDDVKAVNIVYGLLMALQARDLARRSGGGWIRVA